MGTAAQDLYDAVIAADRAGSAADLDRAAQLFARAVVTAGIATVLALLLRRSAAKVQAGPIGPGVRSAMRSPSGLVRVGPDTQVRSIWRRPTTTLDPALPAAEGATTPFGDMTLSTRGSVGDQLLARFHESVHSWLSPRFGLLRNFRVRLGMSGYVRSTLLRYLEEAMAETYAQLRVNGLGGLLAGIRFPVANGYVTIQQLAGEGTAIGTVVSGSAVFAVAFHPGQSSDLTNAACAPNPVSACR